MSEISSDNKILNILQINKSYYPHIGGIESLVKQYSEDLSRMDNTNVKVLVCRDDKGKGSVEIIDGIEVHRANSWGTFFSCPLSWDFIRQFRRMAKEADVVEIHVPFPLADIALLLSRYKGKVVVAWHSDVVKQKRLMLFYKPFMRYLLRRADKIIVATQGHIDGSSYLQKHEEKCVVNPYGLTLSEYDSIERKPILSGMRTDEKAVKIFFSGRFVYYKGIDVLLRAFRNVGNAELFIVGKGKLEDSLREYVNSQGMNNRVHFMGFLSKDDLKAAFADCDIFVLPSIVKSEAFGIVQIEAMVYGKPVINTDLPSGVPHVSVNGKSGITVPPNDEVALAKAIQELVDDEKLRQTYGAEARRRVETLFNEENIIVELRRILSE